MRSLSLDISALNDEEYTLFTSSVTVLVAPDPPPKTDDDYTNLTFPVRDARLFLRGRYSDHIATGPSQDATLSSGQFFAICRRALHIRSGAGLDSDLVFTQSLGKWQDVNSHYHSANFVLLLPFCPFLVSQFHSIHLGRGVRDDITAIGSPPFKRPRLDALEARRESEKLHHVSSVAHSTFQSTSKASLQHKLPLHL